MNDVNLLPLPEKLRLLAALFDLWERDGIVLPGLGMPGSGSQVQDDLMKAADLVDVALGIVEEPS